MSHHVRSTRSADTTQRLTVPMRLFSSPDCSGPTPLRAAVCLPKGRLTHAAVGELAVRGIRVPVQTDVTSRWSDDSIRWLTLSAVLPPLPPRDPEGRKDSNVSRVSPGASSGDTPGSGENAPAWSGPRIGPACGLNPAEPVTLALDPEPAAEDRGLTQVRIAGQALMITQQQLADEVPDEFCVRAEPQVRDAAGRGRAVTFESVREELRGPVRRVFVVSGRLSGAPQIVLQWRVSVWPGAALMAIETRIRNTRRARHRGGLWDLGDPGSMPFRALELTLSSPALPAASSGFWKTAPDARVRTAVPGERVSVIQFGSGGRCWRSTNHVAADGEVGVVQRGFEASSAAGILRGHRSQPVCGLRHDGSRLAAAIPEFWQQFPASLTLAEGRITCGLIADAGGVHELQGGEQKTRRVWLQFGAIDDARDDRDVHASLDWVSTPPRLLPEPEWTEACNVFPWFAAPDATPTQASANNIPGASAEHRLTHYLREATGGDRSLTARRERIDEYGWRNFGEVHADHEQTHYRGSNTVISHYNNQFDLVYGGLLQEAASGNPGWADLYDPLARHVMDIDIYHTDDDRAVFNGGLFWHTDHYVDARTATHRTYSVHNQRPGQPYGGGPCNEHNYTTGLLYYYYLTGHPEARDSVLTLAEWVLQMDDGRKTVFALIDDGPTGYASHTVFEDYHGPGRGSGNSLNAVLDAWLLTRSDRYLQKAEELIRRCVHPAQDIAALNLLDAEGHWSYTVFLTALGRYLQVKREAGDLDAMYTWARDSLAHFGCWMAEHERPSLSCPEELEYPTEAWAAQDFRKANALRIAAACVDDASTAAALRTKADELNDAAWRDLYAFGRQHLTARCLSILMTEGQRDLYHRTRRSAAVPPGPEPLPPDPWSPFVPQRLRVKALLRSPRRWAAAAVRAVHPGRLCSALDALQRHR